MKFMNPMSGDMSVTDNAVVYTMKYYRSPDTVSGVTDETYTDYDASTTYNVGDFCIIPELKGIYRSSLDGNTGKFPPANENSWTYWGPINSYKMLAVDEFIGAQTVGEDCVFEMDFSRLTAFSILDCNFDICLIEQIDNSTGEVINTEEFSGSGYGATSYYEYFYGDYNIITRIYSDNFDYISDSTLKITFTGSVAVGAFVVGVIENMGCTLYGTSLRFEDTSTIHKSPVSGYRTVTRYGHIRVLGVKVMFDAHIFNEIVGKTADIIGRNILFVPTDQDRFTELISIGYFEDFELPLDNPSKIKTQATIIGVI